ncbi:MAG TPA: hypothetical protein VGQ38_05710 [Gaiellaceae bacterium]|nr:hypothetical protein [Gaiellaceae bacterium]
MGVGLKGLLAGVAALVLLCVPAAAAADNWLPHPDDATWTWSWSDAVYATTPTAEKITVQNPKGGGSSFALAWTTADLSNPDGAVSSAGTVSFQETNAGLVNTDWSSTPPPPQFPVLCAQASSCGNALSSVLYNLIWGSRQPLLAEPLVKGASWASTGGAANDVSSISTYRGQESVVVPAFPDGVTAAKVETKITQAGALGDPYGSGTRTVWWVYGVGPVKIEFDHAGGTGADITTAALQSTSLTALGAPNDADYFPLVKDSTMTFRWTNPKHLRKPEVDQFVVDAVVNGTARLKLQSASGPVKAAGTYGFSKRLDGVTNLWGTTSSTGTAKFPPLGPAGASADHRNHFVTALDLLTFGVNPILEAYPAVGDHWGTTRAGTDYRTYGVDGVTTITGTQRVKVPAGTFTALVVRSTLKQPGFPFGSGTRTCWFAPGKGLVKLVFAHRDGSVSTVERLK